MTQHAHLSHFGKLPALRLRYEALLERTNDAVFLIGLDSRFLKVSRRVVEMLGYRVDELIGRKNSSIVARSEAGESRDRLEALRNGASFPIFERTLVTKDGRELPVEIDAALVRDDEGNPLYVQSIVRDISERRREEEALRLIVEGTSSQTGTGFFQSLVQHLAAVLDMEYVLVAECVDTGPSPVRTLAFWSDGQLLDDTEYEPSTRFCEQVLDGTMRCCEERVQERFPEVADLRRFHADSYLCLPLLYSRTGTVIGHLAVMGQRRMRSRERVESIVKIFAARASAELARLQAERALHESEERYRLLVERLPAVTYIDSLKRDRRVRYISPQIELLLGYPVKTWTESDGQWRRSIHSEDRDRVLEAYERARQAERSFSAEYRLIGRDGRVVWVRDETVGIPDKGGNALLTQGVIVDITERKKLEEEMLNTRKLESVGLLAGGIAHDFNNLLMGILGSLSLAKMQVGPNQPAFYRLHEAEKVAQRAKALAHQLLSLSKGGAPIRRTTELAGQIRDTVLFVLSGSSVQAELSVDDGLWPVDADVEQISQVIENMIINAMQAMPEGGRVWVSARNVELGEQEPASLPTDRYIRIDIRDEGIGIRREDLGRIFDPYFTLKQNGNGLGLAMCHAVVGKHDGRIQAESEPGVGTTFSVFLPASQKTVSAPQATPVRPLAYDGRVLVMDDEATVRSVVAEMLEHLGALGRFARNGSEAVEMYRRARERGRPFDVVILDLTVPGALGGKEAMRMLLEFDPQARVIVSSGYSDDPVMSEHAHHGFVGCLAKPYDVQDLLEALWLACRPVATNQI